MKMNAVRNVTGVIVGYLIFAVSAVLLFKVSGIDPHVETGLTTKFGVVAFGCVFSFFGGYAAKLISAADSMTVNVVLAILMAAFAAFSLFRSPGEHYTQIAAIFLFAPVSVLGGNACRSK